MGANGLRADYRWRAISAGAKIAALHRRSIEMMNEPHRRRPAAVSYGDHLHGGDAYRVASPTRIIVDRRADALSAGTLLEHRGARRRRAPCHGAADARAARP